MIPENSLDELVAVGAGVLLDNPDEHFARWRVERTAGRNSHAPDNAPMGGIADVLVEVQHVVVLTWQHASDYIAAHGDTLLEGAGASALYDALKIFVSSMKLGRRERRASQLSQEELDALSGPLADVIRERFKADRSRR